MFLYHLKNISDKSIQLIINESGITTKTEGSIKWDVIYLAEIEMGTSSHWNLVVKNQEFKVILNQELNMLDKTPREIEQQLDETWLKVKGKKRVTYDKYPAYQLK